MNLKESNALVGIGFLRLRRLDDQPIERARDDRAATIRLEVRLDSSSQTSYPSLAQNSINGTFCAAARAALVRPMRAWEWSS